MGLQKLFGFVSDKPINQMQIWRNRQNPNIYKCFKMVY